MHAFYYLYPENYVRRIFPFLILLFVSVSCFAQADGWNEGYYISPQSDTVYGVFNFDKVSKKVVRYKSSVPEKQFKKLYPEDVRSISCNNGLFYRTTTVKYLNETDKIFIERVVTGTINLYQGTAKGAGKVIFIDSQDKEGLVSVNRKSPKTFFQNYFKDCPVPSKIGYDVKSIQRVIKMVHECRNQGQPALVLAPEEKAVFYVGLKANAYTYQPKVSGYYFFQDNYMRKTNIGFGLAAKSELSRRIGLAVGLEYQKKEIETDSLVKYDVKYQTIPNPHNNPQLPEIVVATSFTYRYVFRVDYNYLRIPFGLEYYFTSHKKSSFTLTFGGVVKYMLSMNVDPKILKASSYHSGNPDTPPIEFGNMNFNFDTNSRISTDFFGGLGFKKKLSPTSMLELFVTYHKSNDKFIWPTEDVTRFISVKSDFIQTSLIYYFRI